ncbi:MAG TPA: hypothetical protein VM513_02710 [Kofleriaceae bacterium]|jgi:hypothetical protein|nr:hypothetical protein [Kofleriaceae bacterium]
MRRALIFALVAGCGGNGPGSSGPDGASADAASCVTTIACSADADCAAAPGTRCNTALPVPRCQPLECGGIGTECAGPEFCSAGLVCFDEAHFGEAATIYKAGVCTPPGETRPTCITRCMAQWRPDDVLDPCTQQQATTLCQEVCAMYPAWTDACENYFTRFNANDFRFRPMFCTSFSCPRIPVECGGSNASLPETCPP